MTKPMQHFMFFILVAGLAVANPAFSQQDDSDPAADAPATATPADELSRSMNEAAQAYALEDHEQFVQALEKLHRLRPFNYDFMRQLVMGYALLGKTSEAFNIMLKMQQQGLSVNWDEVEEVSSLRRYPLYEHLNDLMVKAGQPLGQATTLWKIPKQYPMPEALAHDSDTGRVFVGTIRDGLVLVRGESDTDFNVFASPETIPGLKAVFDVLVDEQRGHLWVASGSTSHYRHARKADFGRTLLLKLDLETGEKLDEYRVLPDGNPHLLAVMTQASDGTIYAADALAPMIYKLAPEAERPQAIIGNPMFTSLRGLALSPDQSRLYVVDYDLGLFFYDLDSGAGYALGAPESLNLGGIDGLYRWEDSLVAVQNGVTPQRVLRLDLDDSGTRVASVASLAVAQPEFQAPTFGALAGDDLVFLGASHWDHVDATGRATSQPLPAIPVMRSPIDEALNVMVGEEALEKLKRNDAEGN